MLLLAAILVVSGVKTFENYRTITYLAGCEAGATHTMLKRSKKYRGSRFLLTRTVGVRQEADTSHATNSTEDFA